MGPQTRHHRNDYGCDEQNGSSQPEAYTYRIITSSNACMSMLAMHTCASSPWRLTSQTHDTCCTPLPWMISTIRGKWTPSHQPWVDTREEAYDSRQPQSCIGSFAAKIHATTCISRMQFLTWWDLFCTAHGHGTIVHPIEAQWHKESRLQHQREL